MLSSISAGLQMLHSEPLREDSRPDSALLQQALVAIVSGTQAVGVGVELREDRIELAKSGDGRTLRHIRAGIAGRFQLAGATDAFIEQGQLIGSNGGAGRRVWADDRDAGLGSPDTGDSQRCSGYRRGHQNLFAPDPMSPTCIATRWSKLTNNDSFS